ncbi:MAG TPA: HNH endonuclease [Jatrophihabitans sp.]|jgi:5-methylcytosine-specific restriction endonuclease McrA|nr:HNH endonuclease [Jatrophihabitans sp.]
MGAALVLNATYEPLCVVPLRRAVVLVLAEKAVIVESTADVMHSERLAVPVPTVVRLARFVRVPYRREVPLTRRAVLERDNHACAYCAGKADTIDHVRPRSRGGQHVWTNVVAACARCNHRKGDRLLSEIGWHLGVAPAAPPATVAVVLGWTAREPSWARYLGLPEPAAGAVAPAV